MNIGMIIGMTTLTVGSAVAQKVLTASGKSDAAQYMEIATISGLAITALTVFTSFIKTLGKMG